jgi:hypothetical protein
MALCLAAAAVQAEPVTQDGSRPTAARESRVDKPKLAEPQRRLLTAVALTFTDDADSVRLPAFATPTTPMPMRFVRVGIQWSF